MFVRITSIKSDPAKLEQGIANFKEKVVPGARSAPGFVGAVLMVDRQAGTGYAVTYWESLAAMNQAEQLAEQLRVQSTEATGVEITDVDRFEITLWERKGEVQVPAFVRANLVYANLKKLDELIAWSREKVAPTMKTQPGFVSLLGGINRMTGRSFITGAWATAEDRERAEATARGLRSSAAAIAGGDVRVELGEIVFAEIKQQVATG